MKPHEIADRFAGLPPPLIVYNKSHSGSRLLTDILIRAGVFMGANLNGSFDALPILEVVRHVTLEHYPVFSKLFAGGDALLAETTLKAFARHLIGHDGVSPWGWKLPESLYALPFFSAIFPRARVIHLIRDGRDVALSDHVAPDDSFWRKVYFNTDTVRWWRQKPLDHKRYRRNSGLYNAQHWVNAVSVGRTSGSMLGDRYLEIRYEELVTDPGSTIEGLLDWAGLAARLSVPDDIARLVRQDRIGKFAQLPTSAQRAILLVLEPTLTAFGYGAAGWVPTRLRKTP